MEKGRPSGWNQRGCNRLHLGAVCRVRGVTQEGFKSWALPKTQRGSYRCLRIFVRAADLCITRSCRSFLDLAADSSSCLGQVGPSSFSSLGPAGDVLLAIDGRYNAAAVTFLALLNGLLRTLECWLRPEPRGVDSPQCGHAFPFIPTFVTDSYFVHEPKRLVKATQLFTPKLSVCATNGLEYVRDLFEHFRRRSVFEN